MPAKQEPKRGESQRGQSELEACAVRRCRCLRIQNARTIAGSVAVALWATRATEARHRFGASHRDAATGGAISASQPFSGLSTLAFLLSTCLVRILGLEFFNGTVAAAVDRALEKRGLVVAPSGTCFQRLQRDEDYRRAMIQADLILADSGFMVLLWRLLRGESVARISGLAYLQELLGRAAFQSERSTLWVLPNHSARAVVLAWLRERGFAADADNCYVAPIYGPRAEDPALVDCIQKRSHVVIALSGGVQEKLGFYLREQSQHRPTIHCIGAALGFVTGYQVAIPGWADRLYLGWLLRLLSNPRRFLPRALSAFALPGLIIRYGEQLPVEGGGQTSEVTDPME